MDPIRPQRSSPADLIARLVKEGASDPKRSQAAKSRNDESVSLREQLTACVEGIDVDDPKSMAQARRKLIQTTLARQLGFSTDAFDTELIAMTEWVEEAVTKSMPMQKAFEEAIKALK